MGVLWGVFLGEFEAGAQQAAPTEANDEGSFEKQSLALRTALHYDPSLDTPLHTLVKLYREAGRSDELIGLYRGHIAQYPEDAGAKAVLVRVLRSLNRAEADELAQSAVQVHPESALLNYLLYELRARREDPRALESLARAISLETKPARRDLWAETLLEESGDGAGRELAKAHLEKLREAEGNTAESLVDLAERMHRYQFDTLAFATLQDAMKLDPDPETSVEIEILTAKVQVALGDRNGAGSRLDSLLTRLATDYWRRAEIMNLRIGMLSTEEERRSLLAAARARHEGNPKSESAILEYSELLIVSELRRDALTILRAGSQSLPSSERIEKQLLTLLDQLNDPLVLNEYLEERVAAFPDRPELRYRLVKNLYDLGKREQAVAQLDKVLGQLEPAEADRRLVDLARHLRRSNHYDAAVEIFTRIIGNHPDRFDVIRELSETHLTLKDRGAARSVLRDLSVGDASLENFLDLIQFMVAEDFLSEARQALEGRIADDPERLDLQLPLARVMAKTGERTATEALLLQARRLTDTPARYRLWLETALEVHELFEDEGVFFDNEHQRLLTEAEIEPGNQWSPDRIERFLTYCELGEEKKLQDRVTQALRVQLEDPALPADLRFRLRRLLVQALERRSDRAGEVEQQLQLLAKEDPGRASEYDLRRALMYHGMQRTDLAGETLGSIEIDNIADTKLLKSAYLVFIEYEMPDAARRCLERVTESDPADFTSWEKRLSLLAAMGQEEELRKAIRQLLVEAERTNLGERSVRSLRLHWLDSMWRSVSRRLASIDSESLAEVLPLLDSVDRETQDPGERLWGLWARAFAYNELGQIDARDGVIRELTASAVDKGQGMEQVEIAFPDGLSISLLAGLELLREPKVSEGAPETENFTEGPLEPNRVSWAFEVDPGQRIVRMVSASKEKGDLLILDDRGTCYLVDGASGKLQWRERLAEEDSLPAARDIAGASTARSSGTNLTISNSYYRIQQQGGNLTVQQLMAPYQSTTLGALPANAPEGRNLRAVKLPQQLEVDGEGRFFLAAANRLEARSMEDGSLSWSTELFLDPSTTATSQSLPGSAHPGMRMALAEGMVIAFLPRQSTVSGFDSRTGKLVWTRSVGQGEPGRQENLFALNCGITARGRKVFVYGERSLVLNAEDGGILWRFDGGDVRTFPVSLAEKDPEEGENDDSLLGGKSADLSNRALLDHLMPQERRPGAVKRFFQYQGALVAPAVHWSSARLTQDGAASAVITSRDHLLLFGSEGLRDISLRLPLASRFHPAGGSYLGSVGSQAWFLAGDSLSRLHLLDGTRTVSSVASLSSAGEEIRAVLGGGRLYVIGDKGIRVINAFDGDVIGAWSWPESLVAYRERLRLAEANPMESANADPGFPVWQGVVRTDLSAFPYCLPLRDLAAGDTLFALIGDGAVVALRSARDVNNDASTRPNPPTPPAE